MRDGTVKALSRLHTMIYRVSRGRLGGRLPRIEGPMLLLTTFGRHTGQPHTVPLLYLAVDGARVVVASYGGRPFHPEWYRNLVAEPRATIEVDGQTVAVTASTATPDEKERLWPLALAAYPGYATYQTRTERDIPMVWLRANSQ